MRIVAGAWRGRALVAPPGQGTRPTADRVRQALFNTLIHADWGGQSVIEGAVVLDVFAGTGALGLEALSRGASRAVFIECNEPALRALRANIASCKAQDRSRVLAVDALRLAWPQSQHLSASPSHSKEPAAAVPGPTAAMPNQESDRSASLVFLDPPYDQGLVPRALSGLKNAGQIGENALIVAETSREETWVPEQPLLAERHYGAARIVIFRLP